MSSSWSAKALWRSQGQPGLGSARGSQLRQSIALTKSLNEGCGLCSPSDMTGRLECRIPSAAVIVSSGSPPPSNDLSHGADDE